MTFIVIFMIKKIPKQVKEVLEKFEENNFEAYIVGGCVRDLIMDNPPAGGPKDWDVATNAKPEEIIKIFPDSFYENEFGTVGVKVERFIENGFLNPECEHDVVEVTTYRIESKYSDKRRPDKVEFAKTLEEDLSRRDFTMNAIALKIISQSLPPSPVGRGWLEESGGGKNYENIDSYERGEDIKNKIIRTVGDPHERFDEDALRMMRAVRFHAEPHR